ncbi:extracellular solute-binding protein [Paenibacillus sp. Soil750]|uniref:extracellular solute-binding protein n=1 Tax=Paenibacillus sp. Soil750 TaxID=1736398 RepID=UPI0006F663EC|nr:extracellular solute-binding protein [Paenibacillus sp. Soil750]KRE59824.1 hypothetical protein ASL11_26790 [Paenibacillus sp. Soil750]
MKLRKQVAFGVIASLVVLSACSKDDATSTPSASTATSSAPETAAATKAPPLTLNWLTFVPTNDVSLPAPDKDYIRQAIEQKFNVKLNMEYGVPGEDHKTKINLKISSGATPDMFQADGAQTNQFIIDKAVADLTPYVNPQTMPNYYKWVTPEIIQRYQVQEVFMRAPVPYEKQLYQSYYVRKDWLDKLGLKVPTNYDEMINVMKAFTFGDPDGNGRNDTYGFTTFGNGIGVSKQFPEWYKNGLGIDLWYDQAHGEYVDPQSDIRAGKVLDDIRAVLAQKIVDPDWFLAKPGQELEKVEAGKAGIFQSLLRTAAFDNVATSVKKKTIDISGVKTADFVPFHIMPDAVNYAALPGVPFLFGAKTPPEKIKKSIEIMDWLAGPEGYLLSHFGKEGTNYTKSGNTITLIPDAITKDNQANGNFFDVYSSIFAYGVQDPSPIGLTIIDPRETDHDRAIVEKLKSYKYPVLGTNVAPPPGFDIGAFRTQMRAYMVKILFEEKDASNWPKYRKELMTTYHGKEIFDNYAKTISQVFKTPVVFKSENP